MQKVWVEYLFPVKILGKAFFFVKLWAILCMLS